MEKEIKINIPDGYEIDKENSTFECIKFKPIVNKLPKTWEEYCESHPWTGKEAWINVESCIVVTNEQSNKRNPIRDANLLPNKEYAQAMLALYQLIQLRNCYNDGWIPDWTDKSSKYVIYPVKDYICTNVNVCVSRILTFKTEAIRDEFLNNFKDLIEIAKPLL